MKLKKLLKLISKDTKVKVIFDFDLDLDPDNDEELEYLKVDKRS